MGLGLGKQPGEAIQHRGPGLARGVFEVVDLGAGAGGWLEEDFEEGGRGQVEGEPA